MQGAIDLAEEKRQRRNAKRLRDHYRSMMDCDGEGCGECHVCRHYKFEEWVSQVATRDIPYTVSYDPDVTNYLKAKAALAKARGEATS